MKGLIEIPIKCHTQTAESTIRAATERLKNFKMLGQITYCNLHAREARYYLTCREIYTRLQERYVNKVENPKVKQKEEPHKAAFEYLCKNGNESIIKGVNVEII